MSPTIVPPLSEKCEKCSRCVEIVTISNPFDFDAPSFNSECSKDSCPVSARNQPNSDERVNVYFVTCDAA